MPGASVAATSDSPPGPAWGPWCDDLLRLSDEARSAGEGDVARRLIAGVLDRVAELRDWPVGSWGLRLAGGSDDRVALRVLPPPPSLAGPDLLGAAYEALLEPDRRRSAGAHYTPSDLACGLLDWGLDTWEAPGPALPLRVVDLAVGGGAFLLAAARWQAERGAAPTEAMRGLAGVDLDPDAVAVAEASLMAWAADTGGDPRSNERPRLVIDDGLLVDRIGPAAVDPRGSARPGDDRTEDLVAGSADLVVGNPPFLGQLSRATARDRAEVAGLRARFGPKASGYVDSALLFLVAASRWIRPGGRVLMIQPVSVLGARDGEWARTAVDDLADLAGCWVAGQKVFAAEVDVCALVLERRAPPLDAVPRRGAAPRSAAVRLSRGRTVEDVGSMPPPLARSWAPLLARCDGVPPVALDGGSGRIGDLASATAGFRQHFYGIAPHLVELDENDAASRAVPVLTTGLVDPLRVLWGERQARIAGRKWQRPGVDLEAVAADDAVLTRWIGDRLRPKLVVASQTLVVEAAVDPDGRFVPGVPLVSLEPRVDLRRSTIGGGGGDGGGNGDGDLILWLLAAALSAPPVTAWALQEAAGTGRHRGAVKLASRQVEAVPLPFDRGEWEGAAEALRRGRPLVALGGQLAMAYGLDPDHPVVAWWRDRLPSGAGARPSTGGRCP